jgi:hypothetical protein
MRPGRAASAAEVENSSNSSSSSQRGVRLDDGGTPGRRGRRRPARWDGIHARHWRRRPGRDWWCSRSRSARGREVAESFGARFYADLGRLLADVEAVSIAVPTPAHARSGSRPGPAAGAVLMEKPLAATLDEGRTAWSTKRPAGACPSWWGTWSASTAPSGRPPCSATPLSRERRLAPFQPRGTDVAVVLDLMIHDLDLSCTDRRHRPRWTCGPAAWRSCPPPRHGQRAGEFRRRAWPTSPPPAWRGAGSAGSGFSARRLPLARSGRRAGEFMRLREGWRESGGQQLEEIVERSC